MSDQQQLDDATKALRQIIVSLDRLSKQANRRADKACADGQLKVSSEIRAIEASLRMASAMATEAYAKGRALEIPGDGGMITPFFGGNK